MTFQVSFNEDSDATILGRITARNGSGSATGKDGEGNWLQQADITSITYKYFVLDAPTTVAGTGTLTVSSVVLDTPVTVNTIWTKDSIGYNFIYDIAAATFADGGTVVRIEFTVTLSGGEVFHGNYEGPVCGISSS